MEGKQHAGHKELWRSNLLVLWFGTFMTGIGSSLVTPFLSLYIETLGHFSKKELSFQSGLIFASTFLTMAIFSPIWGRVADRKGRKLMLLRASFGMAVSIFLMGFVTQAWQLLTLRFLLGAFSGYSSNAIALMAVLTPKDRSGKILGTLSTGMVAGALIGPIVGGVIVSHSNYRVPFWMTGTIMFVVFILTLFFVKEKFEKKTRQEMKSVKEIFRSLPSVQVIFSMFLTTLVLQVADRSISPILSLYVKELLPHDAHVTIMSGIVASAPGIVMIFIAPFFGRLGDRKGQYKILFFGLILSLVMNLLLGLTQNIWQLIALRLAVGVSDAALAPSVQVILTHFTPREEISRIFSYNQTAQSIGAVIGPLAGSAVSAYFDYRYVFFFAAAFVAVNVVNYLMNMKVIKQEEAKDQF